MPVRGTEDKILTPDVVSFCESGVSIAMSSCDEYGNPVVGRALGCRVDGSGKVRLVLRTEANQEVLGAVDCNAGLAVTFTQPSTHRSLQLKATCARFLEPDPSDLSLAEQRAAALKVELIADGFLAAFAARYCAFDPGQLAAIEFVPTHAFVQTPGPGAGNPLRP
ncbi:MAG: hypothetical protein KF810_11210 [Rhizobiaceae bacterium]|nr:hypothetical protein [Rhizobiaceae bacterium]